MFTVIICAIIFTLKQYKRTNRIELIIANDYDEMSEKAANIIAELIKNNPNAILGLATGSTPIGTYIELIKKFNNKEISFKNVKTFNLDEYIGLDQFHPQSYYYYMYDHLFKHIDINLNNTHIPKGEGVTETNIKEYEDLLNKNKIIGKNL